MIYQTYQPRSPLSQFVEFLWYWEGDKSPSRSCLLPIGSMELVIDLHEDEIPLFDLYSKTQCGSTKGARICGVHSKGFIIAKDQNCSVMGAHFKPGGSAAFFTIPGGELHNQIISLEELWQGSATELRGRLLEKPTTETRFLVLEQFLLSFMQPLAYHPVVDFALREFERLPTSPVSTVTSQIGFSTRHFNQLFRDRVGLTPKLYCRVRRLQRVLCLIKGKKQIDWLDISLTCGYFDQSHLIHDFRTFANCTPTEYVAKRGFHPCHVELSN
ncbi:AraC family transcriptional regulator [Leptolyngbya sp. NK1-12]|uniref:AraC family transcriptional regulator n=1 Tax=Leptolyngbya sp. NK1-12 TaxID=2547451 RepID=A0AA96WIU3_9CYAN|nr:helix-turn-helix transcriptional regulator [Leptolyngbya sp. NK1-12]WNZ22166.1 AraC family transcriptional regulator [Leptolyngbya sp. NK1-12]